MTRFRFWEPIPLYVALRTLTDQTILALPPGKDVAPIVFSVGYPSEDHIALRYARLPDLDKASSLLAPNQTLEVAVRLFTLGVGVECIAVPPIQWPGRGDGLALRTPVAGVGALAAGAAPLILGGTIGAAFALPAAALAYLVLWSALRRRRGARVLTAGDLHLDGTNLVDYAIARRLGEPATARTDRERHARVAKRIDDIRADYGRRSADIAYRIENSALFDAAVPTTAAAPTRPPNWPRAPPPTVNGRPPSRRSSASCRRSRSTICPRRRRRAGNSPTAASPDRPRGARSLVRLASCPTVTMRSYPAATAPASPCMPGDARSSAIPA